MTYRGPSVPYERLCTYADLSVAPLEQALIQLGNPEGVCCVHVSPQMVMREREWLDRLVEYWAKGPRAARNPLQIVADPDVRWTREWFLEVAGRRIGSPSA